MKKHIWKRLFVCLLVLSLISGSVQVPVYAGQITSIEDQIDNEISLTSEETNVTQEEQSKEEGLEENTNEEPAEELVLDKEAEDETETTVEVGTEVEVESTEETEETEEEQETEEVQETEEEEITEEPIEQPSEESEEILDTEVNSENPENTTENPEQTEEEEKDLYEPYLVVDGEKVTVEANGSSIFQYRYALGHYEDYDSLVSAPDLKTVNYSNTSKTFSVDEDGEYTVRIVYSNRLSVHKYITVTIPAEELKEAARKALNILLTDAEALRNATTVDTKGENILPGNYWVTQTQMDLLDSAIYIAKDLVTDVKASVRELNLGKSAFDVALDNFKKARVEGVKEYPDLIKEGTTITVDAKGNSIKQYRYTKGYYPNYAALYDYETSNPKAVTTVFYSESTKSFTLDETGEYTVRIVLQNGLGIHRYVEITNEDLGIDMLAKKKEQAIGIINNYAVSNDGVDVPKNRKWITQEEKDQAITDINDASTIEEVDKVLEYIAKIARVGLMVFANIELNENRVTINSNGNDLYVYNYAKGPDLKDYNAMAAAGMTTVIYSESTKSFVLKEDGYYTVRIRYMNGYEQFETIFINPTGLGLHNSIVEAEALLESVKISEDGTDIMEVHKWVTREEYEALRTMLNCGDETKLRAAIIAFEACIKYGLLMGARVETEGFKMTVLEGRTDDPAELKGEIWIYYYLKGTYNTYNDMYAVGIEPIFYSKATNSFEVPEIGDYTVRVVYKDKYKTEEFFHIELTIQAIMEQLITQAERRYAETDYIQVDNSEDGNNIPVDEQWIREIDRNALMDAIIEAKAAVENAVEGTGAAIAEEDIQKLRDAIEAFEANIQYGNRGGTSLSWDGLVVTINPPEKATIRLYQYASGHYDNYNTLMKAEDVNQITWMKGTESFTVPEVGEYTVRVVYWPDTITGVAKEAEFLYVEITNAQVYRNELISVTKEAEKLLPTIISVDGKDVHGDSMWTTREKMDELEAAIESAIQVAAISPLQSEERYKNETGALRQAIIDFNNSLYSGRLGIPYLTVEGASIEVVASGHKIHSYRYITIPRAERYSKEEFDSSENVVVISDPDSYPSFMVKDAGTYTVHILYDGELNENGDLIPEELFTCTSITDEELKLANKKQELMDVIEKCILLASQTTPADSQEGLAIDTWYASYSAFEDLNTAIKTANNVCETETTSKNVAFAILNLEEAYEDFRVARKCASEKTPYIYVEGTMAYVLTENTEIPIINVYYAAGSYETYEEMVSSGKIGQAEQEEDGDRYFFEPDELGTYTVRAITQKNGSEILKDYYLKVKINKVSTEGIKSKLEEAIIQADKMLSETVISDTEEVVYEGKLWVTMEDHAKMQEIIEEARHSFKISTTYEEFFNAKQELDNAVDWFKGIQKAGILVDFGPLDRSIEAAVLEVGKVAVSVDGSDVRVTKEWVTEENMNWILNEIEVAKSVKEQPGITGEDVAKAVKQLNESMIKFRKFKQFGLLAIEPYIELDGNYVRVKLDAETDVLKINTIYYAAGVWLDHSELNANKALTIAYSDVNDGFMGASNTIYTLMVTLDDGNVFFLYTAVPEENTNPARNLLDSVLQQVKTQKSGINASINGKDIPTDEYWVKTAYMNELEVAIEVANQVYDNESATNNELIKQIVEMRKYYKQTEKEKAYGIPANSLIITTQNSQVTIDGTNIWLYYYIDGIYNSYDELIAAGATQVFYRPLTKTFEVNSNSTYTVRVVYDDRESEIRHITIEDFEEPKIVVTPPEYMDGYNEQGMQEVNNHALVQVVLQEGTELQSLAYARGQHDDINSSFTWLNDETDKFYVYGNDTYTAYVTTKGGYNFTIPFVVDSYIYPTMTVDGSVATIYPNLKDGPSFIAYAQGRYDDYYNAMAHAPGKTFATDDGIAKGLTDSMYTFCVMGKDGTEYFLYYNINTALKGTAEGQVACAVTGLGIPNAVLKLKNSASKEGYLTGFITTTGSDGNFKIEDVPAGNYTLVALCDGYITDSIEITVRTSYPKLDYSLVLSPVLPEDQYRAVLTWGDNPKDLDAVLMNLEGGDVSHENKKTDNAILDRDEREGRGPETLTILNLASACDFKVQDYTNRSNDMSDALASSGAVVKIYKGGKCITTVDISEAEGTVGTWWNVFSISENGKLSVINKIVK